MSPDTKFNTCSIEQELSDDDIDRELRHAEALELVRLSSETLRPACCVQRAARALTVMLRTSQVDLRPPSLQHKLYSLALSCAGCTCTAALATLPPQMRLQITSLRGCWGNRARGALHIWWQLQGRLAHAVWLAELATLRCAATVNAEREVALCSVMHPGSHGA